MPVNAILSVENITYGQLYFVNPAAEDRICQNKNAAACYSEIISSNLK